MATWVNLVSDSFQRANSANGAVGNNWIDSADLYSILNQQLRGLSPIDYGIPGRLQNQQLLRPAVENQQDQQITLTTGTQSQQYNEWAIILRQQDTNNFYVCQLLSFDGEPNAGTLTISKIIGGVMTGIGSADFNTPFVPGTNYQLQFSAVGVSPTTLTATASIVGGSTVATVSPRTDSTSPLQQPGQSGVACTYDSTNVLQFTASIITQINNAESFVTDIPAVKANGGAQTVNVTGTGTNWGGGTSWTYTGGAVTAVVHSTTSATLTVTPGSTAQSCLLSDGSGYCYLPAVTPSISTAPLYIPAGSTAQSVVVTGVGTLWESVAPVWTLSGGGVVTASVVSANYTTTLTINAPSVGAKMTLTDTTTGASCYLDSNISALPGSPDFYTSPYNVLTVPGVSMESTYPGAYLKTIFTGDKVYAYFDVSRLVTAGTPTSEYPYICYSIDGGAPQIFQPIASGLTLLPVPVPLTYGTSHTFFGVLLNFGVSGVNRWTQPSTNAVVVNSLQTNGAFEPYAPAPNLILFNGDSWLQGFYGPNLQGVGVLQNALFTVCPMIAQGHDAEYGVLGVGGLGYTIAGDGGVPAFSTSVGKYNSANALTLTENPPQIIYVMLGANDGLQNASPSAVQAAAVSSWQYLRAQSPTSYIFPVVPVGQWMLSALQAAQSQYLETPDTKFALIQPPAALGIGGNAAAQGLTTGTLGYPDELHPRVTLNMIWGAYVLSAALQFMGAASVWADSLPGPYLATEAGGILANVQSLAQTILAAVSGKVIVTSPQVANGGTMTVYQSYDFVTANAQAPYVTVPGLVVGLASTCTLENAQTNEVLLSGTVATTSTPGTYIFTFQITASIAATLSTVAQNVNIRCIGPSGSNTLCAQLILVVVP